MSFRRMSPSLSESSMMQGAADTSSSTSSAAAAAFAASRSVSVVEASNVSRRSSLFRKFSRKEGIFGGGFSSSGTLSRESDISARLRKSYKKILRPLEETSLFAQFGSSAMEDADFDAKPVVMVVGQYSTGKTTLIRYLLGGEDFPGIRIGPEPTTDTFSIIMKGNNNNSSNNGLSGIGMSIGEASGGIVPGNALVMDSSMQYRPLSKFGSSFLNRLQCCHSDSAILNSLSFVDTPGILSGEKQSHLRGYDYTAVLQWFAEKVDRIVILFDANKLDISDELGKAIVAIRKHDDKIRIVLNKADSVRPQQLMRVYGALMWSLGKVFDSPEVVRVHIASLWDQPLCHDEFKDLLEAEQNDLMQDLRNLPRQAALRKVNDFIKRSRSVKIHALIISELAKRMPTVFGKEKKKKELISNLYDLFKDIIDTNQNVSAMDFPDVDALQEKLRVADWTTFKVVDPKTILKLDQLLSEDLTKLMEAVPGTLSTTMTPSSSFCANSTSGASGGASSSKGGIAYSAPEGDRSNNNSNSNSSQQPLMDALEAIREKSRKESENNEGDEDREQRNSSGGSSSSGVRLSGRW